MKIRPAVLELKHADRHGQPYELISGTSHKTQVYGPIVEYEPHVPCLWAELPLQQQARSTPQHNYPQRNMLPV